MNFREYIEETEANAKEAIAENFAYCDTWEDMSDWLWIDDAVTGNGSGSYTFNSHTAAENVSGILWDSEFADELLARFGYELGELIQEGPEAFDVTARCLALGYCEGLEEYFDELKEAAEVA